MESRTSEEKNNDPSWEQHDDVWVHRNWLKKGFLFVAPSGIEETVPSYVNSAVTETDFTMKNWRLKFVDNGDFDQTYKQSTGDLLSKIPGIKYDPYSEWDIYVVSSKENIDPTSIKGKAIILTNPVTGKTKSFKTAYLIKNKQFIRRNESELTVELNSQGLRREQRQLIEQDSEGKIEKKDAHKTLLNQIAKIVLLSGDVPPFDVFIHAQELRKCKDSERKKQKDTSHSPPLTTTFEKAVHDLGKPTSRREFFVPDSEGLYISASLPIAKKRHSAPVSEFQPVQFFTVGCLFGTGLLASSPLGKDGTIDFALIKHDLPEALSNKEIKITAIKYNRKINPYEEMLFGELERLAYFIENGFPNSQQRKQLLYHLPYLDYILFGVELFIRGRITVKALTDFFKVIFQKAEDYKNKIEDICKKHNIEVKIESPFDNLFDQIDKNSTPKSILLTLSESTDEVDPLKIDEAQQKVNEKKLVEHILTKLTTNSKNDKHRQVWCDILRVYGKDKINTLDKLFKLANAAMVAIASKDQPEYKTCTLLPLTEYRIPDAYKKFQARFVELNTQRRYTETLNVMFLDPLYTLGQTNDHTAFSAPPEIISTTHKLITNGEMLKTAFQNASFFSRSKDLSSQSNSLKDAPSKDSRQINQTTCQKPKNVGATL